ncbi:MAG: hypothetical protein F4Y16_08140 [Holophagales bacterium]|nr:hypothetical protein [Holophagales bacterium]
MDQFPFKRADVLTEVYKFFGAHEEGATSVQKIRAEVCYKAYQKGDRALVLDMLKEAEHDKKWEGQDSE